MKNIKNNIRGSVVIIIVFLSLVGFMSLTILASDIIKTNLVMSKSQLNSTKAYFAAEVGLEQALWEVMKGDYELPDDDVENVFTDSDVSDVDSFLADSVYNVDYDRTNSIRTFKSRGGYLTEHRSTEVSFCIPNCEGVKCGEDDGCGTPCPPACETDIGCRLSQPADSIEVEGSEDFCCDSKKCYECEEDYVWNGSACVYDCVQECGGLQCGDIDPNCGQPCPPTCDTNPGCVLSTDPAPSNAEDSGLSCCDIGASSYTCYQCAEGSSWDGSECVTCVAYEGDPYPGSTACYDAGVYDCFGNQSEAEEQPEKGTSCSGGDDPVVHLGMNEAFGVTVYDSTDNNYDGTIEGDLWPYRKLITIDHSYFDNTSYNFPFLLDIADLNLFYFAQDDGDDIIFKTTGGVKIPHEIEYFNGDDYDLEKGKLVAWLKLPELSSTIDTEFYMYYGSDIAPNQEDSDAVWSSYRGVWHLNSSSATDSSNPHYNLNFTTSFYTVDATIYDGVRAPGAYAAASIPAYKNDFSFSAWIRTTYYSNRLTYLYSTKNSYLSSNEYEKGPCIRYGYFGYCNDDDTTHFISSGVRVDDGDWHHVAVASDYGSWACKLYIDGVLQVEPSCYLYVLQSSQSVNWISRQFLGSSSEYDFNGYADEMRLADTMFDDAYFHNSYVNQVYPRVMVSVGEEQVLSSGESVRVNGVYGRAIALDGSSNYIDFVDGDLPIEGDKTVEAWIYLPDRNDNYSIASKGWNFYVTNLGWLSLGGSAIYASALPLNTWTHVAFTYDDSSGELILYINGSDVLTTNVVSAALAGNDDDLVIGNFGTMYFSGKIDEFKIYDYVKTADQVADSYSRDVCDGEGSCVNLVTSPLNSASYDTCNDICYVDGRTCSSVGTDSAGTNGIMSVYDAGSCDTIEADCSTLMTRNPDVDTPFLCSGYQTDWTNCNCLLCDADYGLPCEENACITAGTGMIDCSGECSNAEYEPAGTSCGDYMECDGLGNCRNVCHPLFGKTCSADQCHGSGIVDCDGFCVGGTNVADGTTCINTNNDPLEDECWGGICEECVAEYGDPCNVGECLNEGVIDCFGGCSACTNGNCLVYPSYLAEDTPCDAGYGDDSGICDNAGTCDACHSDYLNLGVVCNDEPCHVAGERDCETGVCSTAGELDPVDTYCTTVGGDPGACLSDGTCFACASGYMDPCNNATPCLNEGYIECDGVTCSESGYLAEGESCDAGYLTSPNYPDTGTCDASHNCNPCYSGYLDGLECNTEACHISGYYTCDGGCDACVDDDCVTNPNNQSEGSTCDTGAVTSQPYSGICDASGNCDSCAQGFLDGDSCNDEECHVEGVVECDGTCSTGTQVTPEGGECDGSISDGYPGRQTGYCDNLGVCQDCNDDFVYDRPCWPEVGNEGCYDYGEVYTCQGICEDWSYKAEGTTCDTGAVTTQDYSGTCDSSGNCDECVQGFLDNDDCNTAPCHIPGKVQCDGTCSTGNSVYAEGTTCDTGAITSQPYSGTCDAVGNCDPCDQGFLDGDSCNTEKCHVVGEVLCDGTCSTAALSPYGTGCDAEIAGAVVSPTGYCDGSGSCLACLNDYLYQTPCWPEINDEDCYNKGVVPTCQGTCNWSYVKAGTPCGTEEDECDGSGVCTTLINPLIVYNRQSRTCDQICEGSPYVGRICVDVGTDTEATNNLCIYNPSYTVYSQTLDAYCSTQMLAYGQSNEQTYSIYYKWTNCRCMHCEDTYEQVCQAVDDCNNESYYDCDGVCVNSYKANNSFCDPVGAPTDGYCWYGGCVECVANMGDVCNDGECENPGTVLCNGSCSAASDPYMDSGEHCDSGSGPDTGICDGAGTCDYCNLALLDTACPVPANRDAECYDPGVYDCDTNCVDTALLNSGGVCYVDGTAEEGRCSSGQCVACNSAYYGNPCPVVSPYDSNCYDAGTYDCLGDPPACVGATYLNQSTYSCTDPDAICLDGQCQVYPDILVVPNYATGATCASRCAYYGHNCYSIGTDDDATNGFYYSYTVVDGKNGGYSYSCDTSAGDCSTALGGGATTCDGHTAFWSNCLCTNCIAGVFGDCSGHSMWDSTDYDDECYDFGTYDCDGACENYEVIAGNEGITCTNDTSGYEGICTSGECVTCDTTYINNVPCPTIDCQVSTRLCDGSCTSVVDAAIGTSCGAEGYECNLDGDCVEAATELVDIVVPNVATSRSCNAICENDYTNRTCESIGTDDTQAGGTNGLIMYFGLDDGTPTCVGQSGGTCSTTVTQNPSSASDTNYGFTCDEQLTNWTYCRCTNE